VLNGEPLGHHSVMLTNGGGRRVVCGCKTSTVDPNTNSPGPAGSATLNGDSTAEVTPGDSPSAPLLGKPGGLGEDVRQERARLLCEYTAERIDDANAADFVRQPYRAGFPTRERVAKWNREWLELEKRARGLPVRGREIVAGVGAVALAEAPAMEIRVVVAPSGFVESVYRGEELQPGWRVAVYSEKKKEGPND
jgi:hypothetical protein